MLNNMARLVSVCDSDGQYDFKRRQAPFEVDGIKMIIQFYDKCTDCGSRCGTKLKDLEQFTNKLNTLSKDEVAEALLVSGKDFLSALSNAVPCVGCKKSVERLYNQLQKSQHPALEPLVITPWGELSVHYDYLFSPPSLFSLFFVHGSKLRSVVESIPKSKKNKRCNLHSLETHKTRSISCWIESWDALSNECRDRVLVIDMNKLLVTVDSYLEKHKFCSECKSKVLQAYYILIGEQESTKEAGYCPALYENLRCCTKDRHIHVLNDTDFIAHLLEKAEPEFLESKRDRHAKTLDIAQEEVLTCLGIHIFERLHRIWQKVRSEEQTWLLLYYFGMDCLKKSYQSALEEKQGVSNLELLCEELEEKEKRQEEKRELKRQKKRQRKAKAQNNTPSKSDKDTSVIEEVCKCSTVEPDNFREHQHSRSFRSHHPDHCGDSNFNSLTVSLQSCSLSHRPSCADHHSTDKLNWLESLDTDSCESCSMQGSNEGSEEGSIIDIAEKCDCDMLRASPKRQKTQNSPENDKSNNTSHQPKEQPSLQELLLENYCWDQDEEEEDGFGISEEEILEFRAKQGEVESKRQELRQHLRERFQELHLSSQFNPGQ